MCKKLGGAFCGLLLNEKQKKPFVYLNNEISECHVAASFCIRFHWKAKCKPAQKNTGLGFSKKYWRPHAKIQLIWEKKKQKQSKIRHRMVML